MDGGQTRKGTVTSLSSIFSPDEVRGAARRVEEAIEERRNELDCILSYMDDNSSLVKLVQRLPDQLHHDIMVPFGKGAFFPGKLVHTNEFLVLLGEGYYADRTSKQTVEILNRRGKELEFQVESLKAMIKDLKAEVSFFGETATEAREGLVEIMEDYVEEDIRIEEASMKASTQADLGLVTNEDANRSEQDDKFDTIMAKLDELEELEKAEMAAGGENNNDDDRLVSGNEVEKAERDDFLNRHSSNSDDDEMNNVECSESTVTQMQPRDPVSHNLIASVLKDSATGSVPRGGILLRKDLAHDSGSNSISKKVSWAREVNEKHPIRKSSGEKTISQPRQPAFDSQKAFTSIIVERPYNLEPTNQTGASAQSASLPSKPVSRFQMRRK